MKIGPAWRLAGDWFGICSCDVPCPCASSVGHGLTPPKWANSPSMRGGVMVTLGLMLRFNNRLKEGEYLHDLSQRRFERQLAGA